VERAIGHIGKYGMGLETVMAEYAGLVLVINVVMIATILIVVIW
jgi:hypothetical protein